MNNKGQASADKKSPSPSAFLLKLYRLLEDSENSEIVSWCNAGKSFVIKNVHKFSQLVLPNYYKHKNFSSFIRQLHMYSFHKKRDLEFENVFTHPQFFKGGLNIINQIKRQKKNENPGKPSKAHDAISLFFGPNSTPQRQLTKKNFKNVVNNLLARIREMKDKQSRLEENSKYIIEQNKELLSQNEFLLKDMKNRLEYNKKLDTFILFILEIICQKRGNDLRSLGYGGNVSTNESNSNSNPVSSSNQESNPNNMQVALNHNPNLANSASIITEEILNYLKKNNIGNYDNEFYESYIKNLVDSYLDNRPQIGQEKRYYENPTIKEINEDSYRHGNNTFLMLKGNSAKSEVGSIGHNLIHLEHNVHSPRLSLLDESSHDLRSTNFGNFILDYEPKQVSTRIFDDLSVENKSIFDARSVNGDIFGDGVDETEPKVSSNVPIHSLHSKPSPVSITDHHNRFDIDELFKQVTTDNIDKNLDEKITEVIDFSEESKSFLSNGKD